MTGKGRLPLGPPGRAGGGPGGGGPQPPRRPPGEPPAGRGPTQGGRGYPPGRGRGGPPAPPSLPGDYLAGGYFDDKGNVRPEILTSMAQGIARALKNARPSLTAGQLRQFWGATLAVKRKLEGGVGFDAVRGDIYKLQNKAAYAVGRQTAPELMKAFIDRNVALAVESQQDFEKGFYEHFQAVVAYHKYLGG